jgi:hypothetical protein
MLVKFEIKEKCNQLIAGNPYRSAFKIFNIARNCVINDYNWSDEIFCNLYIFEELKDFIYGKKQLIIPKSNDISFTILNEYTETLKNKNFLLFDQIFESNRIIIWGDVDFINKIFEENELKLFCDGTFFAAPTIFSQIYMFHAFKGRKCFPIFYVFLTNKLESTYVKVLEILKSVCVLKNINYNPFNSWLILKLVRSMQYKQFIPMQLSADVIFIFQKLYGENFNLLVFPIYIEVVTDLNFLFK